MYYLIAFYKRIVELWCHAKNFPNDPRTYELFTLRGENKTLAKLRNHSIVNYLAPDLGLHWLPVSHKETIGIHGLAQALFVLVHIEATSRIFENRTTVAIIIPFKVVLRLRNINWVTSTNNFVPLFWRCLRK